MNQSTGILFDRDHELDYIPEQEIQSELESQRVVSVNRFTKKCNDNIEPTNTYLLTFCMPTLPTNIKIGLYHMKIDMFIPIRCAGLVMDKQHVRVVMLVSSVVKRDMTPKAAKNPQSVKLEELLFQKQRKSFICTVYLNHIYHLMRQL